MRVPAQEGNEEIKSDRIYEATWQICAVTLRRRTACLHRAAPFQRQAFMDRVCARVDVREYVCARVCSPQMAWWPWKGSPMRRCYIPKRHKIKHSFEGAVCSSKPSMWSCWSFEGDCVIFPPACGNASVLYALCLSWVPLHSNSLLWHILKRPGVISYTNKVLLKEIREICMNFCLIYLIIPHYKAAQCSNVITSFQFLSLCKRN